MNNLRNDLIVAFKEGNFLKVVYEKSSGELENCYDIAPELVSLHNDGMLDIIAVFRTLKNASDTGYDFLRTLRIFEKALPHINAPVQQVMECILNIVNDNIAAGTLFTPFTDFCASDPSRPQECLKLIEASIDQFADLLTHTIVAGARIDAKYYLNEAIRLTMHENIEIRIRAIFSLGGIQYSQGTDLCDHAIACLDSSVSKETDDRLLSNLIRSAFSLYKYEKSQVKRIIDIINCALKKGSDYALRAASELFVFDFNELPEDLLDTLLAHLLRVKYENKDTIDIIDCGLAKLLHRENPNKGIEFLENFLIAHQNDLSLKIFDSVIYEIIGNKDLLKKLLTKWFLRGDRILCEGISAVVNEVHGNDMFLDIDPSAFVSIDLTHIVFLARKTIGYLFYKPVTAASVIISLLHSTDDENTLNQLGRLLFDPLLINFPGKVKDYLSKQAESESGKAKAAIETALNSINKYLDDLKSTGVIPALQPSQAHRNEYHRYYSRINSESYKEAEKKSVVSQLFSTSVLLYGRKSVNYSYDPDGNAKRMEIRVLSASVRDTFLLVC